MITNAVAVISHLNQYFKLEEFIVKFNVNISLLIIVHTPMGQSMLKKILNTVETKRFGKISVIGLPKHPNKLNLVKSIRIAKTYDSSINFSNVSDVYMFSYEGHYNYLITLFRENKASIHLIEEGLALYKEDSEMLDYLPLFSFKYFSKAQRNKRNLPMQIILVSLNVKIYIFRLLINNIKVRFIINFLTPSKYKAFKKSNLHFDSCYASHPAMLNTKFKIGSCHFFLPVNKKSLLNQVETTRPNCDAIYVSQRYFINSEVYASFVISSLEKIRGEEKFLRCHIKLHPKEDSSLLKIFNKIIKNENLLNHYTVLKTIDKPVESMILRMKPRIIIGLTSSSLIYVKFIDPNIKRISIAERLLSDPDISRVSFPKTSRELLVKHLTILRRFHCITLK